MKRLLIAFSLVTALLATSSMAFAAHADWYVQKTSATISSILWETGLTNNAVASTPSSAYGTNGYRQYTYGTSKDAFVQMHSVDGKFDMDRPNAAKQDKGEMDYYGYELNYLHLDIRNRNGSSKGYAAPTKFEVTIGSEFCFDYYDKYHNKNRYVADLSTTMEFFYMSGAKTEGNKTYDLVYMVGTSARLGHINYEGEDYYFDVVADQTKIKDPANSEPRELVKLEGELYAEALKNSGLAAGTELWGMFARQEDSQIHMKFDIVIHQNGDMPPPSVPVPAAVWLMGTGVAGLVALRRRQK